MNGFEKFDETKLLKRRKEKSFIIGYEMSIIMIKNKGMLKMFGVNLK